MSATPSPRLNIYASLFMAALSGCSDTAVSLPSYADKIAERSRAELKLAQSPTFESYLAMGLAEVALGHHESGLENFNHALGIDSKAFIARSQLCLENNILQRWRAAILHCRAAVLLQPRNRVVENALSFAEHSLTEMSKLQAPEFISQGLESYTKGDYRRAIESWSEVPTGSPHYAAARNNMASAYILMKDFIRAREVINEALKLDPSNELIRNNASWLERESAQANQRSE